MQRREYRNVCVLNKSEAPNHNVRNVETGDMKD